jgi:hypothetical protein
MNEVIDRKQTKHKFPSTFVKDGKKYNSKQEIANLYNKYFATIGEKNG